MDTDNPPITGGITSELPTPSSILPGPIETPPDSRVGRPPHPGFGMALLWCLLFLIVTQLVPTVLVAAIVLGKVYLEASNVLGPPNPPSQEQLMKAMIMPSMILAQVFSIAFSCLILRIVAGKEWPRQVGLRRPSFTHVILTFLAFPCVVLLANGAYALLKEVLPSMGDLIGIKGLPGMEEMVREFGTWPLWLAVLVIGVGPGVGEELWCRGFLGRGLVGRYGVVIGIVMTSFLFGLIHIDPRQGTMAALMGVVLHYLYQTTRSLWIPMLLHFLNNSLSVIGANRGGWLAVLDQAPEEISVSLYYAAAVLLTAIGVVLYQTQARLIPEPGLALWQQPFPGVAYPPKGSGMAVVRPRLSLGSMLILAIGILAFAAGCLVAAKN